MLSAGQRQCVAIAREIVHDPDLLILDEASSALDGAGETRVQECMKGRTVLLISHQPGMVLKAHHIIVLHEGGVVAEGRHEDLIGSCGIYRKLIRARAEKTSFAVI